MATSLLPRRRWESDFSCDHPRKGDEDGRGFAGREQGRDDNEGLQQLDAWQLLSLGRSALVREQGRAG